jgi:ferredoxin
MTPKVNQELCIGCGTCEAVCPAVFKVDADGKAQVLPVDFAANAEKIKEAITSCPVQAISEE